MRDMDLFKVTRERSQNDFDLLEEIITEDNERRPAAPLPGPPPPPLDLICKSYGKDMESAPTQVVLLSRGTACQPTCTFPQPLQHTGTSREMAHPSLGSTSRRGRGSSCLQGSKNSSRVSCQGHGDDMDMLERLLQKPKLVVVEEPKERGMRFRYECEGRSAGSILGASSTETNKTQPAIEIQGGIEHLKRATVTVSLVTKDPPHRPHPHCLVGKDCPNGSGICVVTINPNNSRRHSFVNLGIQCVRRKELDVSLQKRRSQNIDPFQTGDSKGIEDMDMNAVRLCFQCELEWDDGRKDCLSPVVSNAIYDKKATTTSQLKISCLNQNRGPCRGKTEVFMLCDKVQKDDIEIIFKRGIWKAKGEFAQTDVHRQIAIVFKTPPYQDQDITEEVEVSVILHRLSDQMESDPVSFTYLPYNPDPYEVKRKRKIKSDISFREKPCVAESAPPPEQPFHLASPLTVYQEDRLCAAQAGASTLGEACYSDVLDPCNNVDEQDSLLLNHLLELPGIWEMISEQSFTSLPVASGFEQGTDTACTFGAVDMNHIFPPCTQDFSQYNDMQFNMLVSDNHCLQSEAQDSSMVEVKKEEEL